MEMREQLATKQPMNVVALNAGNAEQFLDGGALLLLDFWAPWCAPCRAIEPLLNQLSIRFGDDLAVAKVNVDMHPELARRFNVRSIPTLVLVRNQSEVVRLAAAECSHDHIVEVLEQHVAEPAQQA